MKVIFLKKKYLFVSAGLLVILFLSVVLYMLFINKPVPTIQLDPIYQGKTNQPGVAITINVDWGEEVIPQMLTVLEGKNTKATFFITGRFAEKFPDIVKQISAQGHEIGNHGYSHPHPDRISVEKNHEEIMKTHKILKNLCDREINLFAPPYGERGANCLKAADQAGYKTILWTADTIDWQQPPPSVNTLVNRVTGKKLINGTIILMHPKAHTLQALPVIIDVIKTKGFQLKTVSEII
ncbi:MAG: polysaccharide deacetylase family protein [Peptococcaceae bacterium]